MLKRFFTSFILSVIVSSTFAASSSPNFVILPNVNTQYLLSVNAPAAINDETKAIEIVKDTLNIHSASAYRTVRIRMLYNSQDQVAALIVYLLSAQFKSVELVRINLAANWKVMTVIYRYHLQAEDLNQSPSYVYQRKPHCPDNNVQFVIGNNFKGDASVEKEVQRVYQAALDKGYHPYLMDVNNSKGPQPTVAAYENWMNCANVKGFYNESHGYQEGILLTDDDFTYTNVNNDLVNKLNHEVVLFDSCLTFWDPLLDAMINPNKGNSQQYVAGIISLPFGASERTARCFWLNALEQQPLTKEMLKQCAIDNGLDPHGFNIAGNGDNHINPPSL